MAVYREMRIRKRLTGPRKARVRMGKRAPLGFVLLVLIVAAGGLVLE